MIDFKSWFAGVYEGEGSIIFLQSRTAPTFRIEIPQHSRNKEILFKIKEILGGSVTIEKGKNLKWIKYCNPETHKILEWLYPMLSSYRQRQVDHVILKFCVNRGCEPILYDSKGILRYRVAGEFKNFDDARMLAQKLRKKT